MIKFIKGLFRKQKSYAIAMDGEDGSGPNGGKGGKAYVLGRGIAIGGAGGNESVSDRFSIRGGDEK